MATSNVRFSLADLGEANVSGVVVSARLVPPGGSEHLPTNIDRNKVVSKAPVSIVLDANGEGTLALTRTSDLPAGWTYTVEFVGTHNRQPVRATWTGLAVPDNDRDFVQVLGQFDRGTAPRYVAITESELNALIEQAGEQPSVVPDSSIDLQKLSGSVRDQLQNAQDGVDIDDVRVDGQDLTMRSVNNAKTARVTLPTDAALTGRVDNLEALEQTRRYEEDIVTRVRISVGTANVAYSLGGKAPADSSGRALVVLVTTIGEPDGRTVIDLTDLLAKPKVVRANASLTVANGIEFTNPPDNNRYRIGVDSSGDLFFSSDTVDTFFVTVTDSLPAVSDEHVQDVVGGMVTGNTETGGTLTYDDGTGKLNLNVTGGGGGLSTVASDATLTGTGAAGDPLKVAVPALSQVQVDARVTEVSPPAEVSHLDALPAIAGYSLGALVNYKGVLFELVRGSDDTSTIHGVIESLTGGFTGAPNFKFTSTAIEVQLPFDVVGSAPPTTVFVEFDDSKSGVHVETLLTRRPGQVADDPPGSAPGGVGAGDNWIYIQTTGRPLLDPTAVSTGDGFVATFWQDEAKTTALAVVPVTNRWVTYDHETPMLIRQRLEALTGTDRLPLSAIDGYSKPDWNAAESAPAGILHKPTLNPYIGPQIEAVTLPGINANPTSNDVRGTVRSRFTPTLDLDDHSHGELHLSLSVTIRPASTAPNMGFVQGKVNQTAADRTRVEGNTIFLSSVAAAEPFNGTTNDGRILGVAAFDLEVYDNTTHVGTVIVNITRDATNELGAYMYWDGVAGGSSATISATLLASFTATDQAAASGGGVRKVFSGTVSAVHLFQRQYNRLMTDAEWRTIPDGLLAFSGGQMTPVFVEKSSIATFRMSNRTQPVDYNTYLGYRGTADIQGGASTNGYGFFLTRNVPGTIHVVLLA